VLALSFCSLFSFSQQALLELLKAYPSVQEKMEQVCMPAVHAAPSRTRHPHATRRKLTRGAYLDV